MDQNEAELEAHTSDHDFIRSDAQQAATHHASQPARSLL